MITYLELIEALKKSIVYRDGKKKILKKSDKEGYKTRKNRSISSKKAAKKKRGQQNKISKLRAKTMKKRK